MTTHLYCVLPRGNAAAVPAGLLGVAGATVRALPVNDLVAWVSDAERGASATVDDIRAHNDVVESALDTGSTPVPARYGQRFEDDEACWLALSIRASAVEPLLATMQGLIEMTLIIAPSSGRMIADLEPVLPQMFDQNTEGVGRRYLDTLRKRELRTGEIDQATDVVASALEEAARPFVRQRLAHQAMTPLPLRTVSHLIARDDAPAYQQAVRGVDGGTEFRFLVIGPRAPYSFCALSEDGGGAHGMNLAD